VSPIPATISPPLGRIFSAALPLHYTRGGFADYFAAKPPGNTMTVSTAKRDSIEAIEQLPDNVPFDKIRYRACSQLSKIRTGNEASMRQRGPREALCSRD